MYETVIRKRGNLRVKPSVEILVYERSERPSFRYKGIPHRFKGGHDRGDGFLNIQFLLYTQPNRTIVQPLHHTSSSVLTLIYVNSRISSCCFRLVHFCVFSLSCVNSSSTHTATTCGSAPAWPPTPHQTRPRSGHRDRLLFAADLLS